MDLVGNAQDPQYTSLRRPGREVEVDVEGVLVVLVVLLRWATRPECGCSLSRSARTEMRENLKG